MRPWVKVLNLKQAAVLYRRDDKRLKKDIDEGALPGNRLRGRYYAFPPEIAFKGVIEKYNLLARQVFPMIGTREVAAILGIPYKTLRTSIQYGQFPRGEMIPGYTRNNQMWWTVKTLRAAIRKYEGKHNKERYSP